MTPSSRSIQSLTVHSRRRAQTLVQTSTSSTPTVSSSTRSPVWSRRWYGRTTGCRRHGAWPALVSLAKRHLVQRDQQLGHKVSYVPWNEVQLVADGLYHGRTGHWLHGHDAACVLLAELTWPDRVDATRNVVGATPATGGNRLSRYGRSFLRMAATHAAKRARRFILYLILVAVMISFYAVAIWSTFGFGRRLLRPICELPGAEGDLNFDWDFWGGGKRARGGWQPDWNATVLELGVIIANCFVLIAIPISESLPSFGLRQADIPAANTLIGRSVDSSTDSRAQYASSGRRVDRRHLRRCRQRSRSNAFNKPGSSGRGKWPRLD